MTLLAGLLAMQLRGATCCPAVWSCQHVYNPSRRPVQAVLDLPGSLQDTILDRAVVTDAVASASVLPRPSLARSFRVPSAGAAMLLATALPAALRPAVARACVRCGELYLPLSGLTAAGVAALALHMPGDAQITAATFPLLRGGEPPPPQAPRTSAPTTVDVSPLLAALTGLTRLTIQGAWPAKSEPEFAEALPLQHLQHLDLSHCNARFVNAVLPLAPPSLRLLNLHGVLLATAETAAHVARLTGLRVLSLEALKTRELAAFIDVVPTLRQLRYISAADWTANASQRRGLFMAIRANLQELRHIDFWWARQNQSVSADPIAIPSGTEETRWPAHLRVVDHSGFQAEAQKLLLGYTLPRLTELYGGHQQVFGVPPPLAGALMARKVSACPSLKRLSLAGFLACSEAALSVAAAATALTFLDLSAPLNKLQAAPLDIAPLAALAGLRVLRLAGTDWRAQGVAAAAFAEVFAAMKALEELWLGVPCSHGHLEWVRDALGGAPATVQRLCFSGLLDRSDAQAPEPVAPLGEYCKMSTAHAVVTLPVRPRSPARGKADVESVSAAFKRAGLQRFEQLAWLAACEELLKGRGPWDGADFGLAAGSHVLHSSDATCEQLPRGVISMWDDHPRDMQRLYQLYAA
jgi:hypothetical protein